MIIFSTTPTIEMARHIADIILEARKAACVNIIPHIESHYRWRQKVEHEEEALLVIKTTDDNFPDIKKLIAENHAYEVPEIVGIVIDKIDKNYSNWIKGVIS